VYLALYKLLQDYQDWVDGSGKRNWMKEVCAVLYNVLFPVHKVHIIGILESMLQDTETEKLKPHVVEIAINLAEISG